MLDEGDEIRFVRGAYKGKTGSLNSEKGATKEQVYAIVNLGNRKLRKPRVNKDSIKSRDETAPS
jgi:hypothetical protein